MWFLPQYRPHAKRFRYPGLACEAMPNVAAADVQDDAPVSLIDGVLCIDVKAGDTDSD
jgi:hypothetical protein